MVIEGIGLGRAGSTSPELLCIHMYVPYICPSARVCVCACVRACACVLRAAQVCVCVCVRVVRPVVCAQSCLMSTYDSTWLYIKI